MSLGLLTWKRVQADCCIPNHFWWDCLSKRFQNRNKNEVDLLTQGVLFISPPPLQKKNFTHVKKFLKRQKKFPPAAGKKSPNFPPAAGRKDQKFSACGGQKVPKFSTCGGQTRPKSFRLRQAERYQKNSICGAKKTKHFFLKFTDKYLSFSKRSFLHTHTAFYGQQSTIP